MRVVGGASRNIVLDDQAWAAVERLVAAACAGGDAVTAAVDAAGGLGPDQRRGVRVTLSRVLFHVVTDALGEGAVTYQSIHDLALRAYPQIAAAVRLDVVEVEHLLRQPFGRSTWPGEELVFDGYVGLAAVVLAAVLRGQGRTVQDLDIYREPVGRWLVGEGS